MSQDPVLTSVERPFQVSVSACSMVPKTPTQVGPAGARNAVPGLADQKDTDRLMDIMPARADSAPPRPAICPICGLTADNGVVVRGELTATATYCDTEGHLWSVHWLEVS